VVHETITPTLLAFDDVLAVFQLLVCGTPPLARVGDLNRRCRHSESEQDAKAV